MTIRVDKRANEIRAFSKSATLASRWKNWRDATTGHTSNRISLRHGHLTLQGERGWGLRVGVGVGVGGGGLCTDGCWC